MKLGAQFRFIQIDRASINEENRTMDLSFSSEAPVDQPFGREILSHDKGAVDLSRLNSGAPLLWNHNKNDVRGVVEKASIDTAAKRGTATVRFSKSAKGEEAFQDAKDGIIRGVSVGYRIKEMKQTGGTPGNPEYTATNWQPNEISLAPVPADPTVGIGRADVTEEREVNVTREDPAPAAPGTVKETNIMTTEAAAATAANENVRALAVTAERERITAITALGARFNKADLATKLVTEGVALDVARAQFLEEIGAKQQPVAAAREAPSDIDLSNTEKKNYSIIRAISASLNANWKDAGFEHEISKEIAKRANKETSGFFIPSSLPMDGNSANAARALVEGRRTTSGTAYGATINAGQGGASLVATDLLSGSFIEVLRNQARVMQAGARMLSGLVGNVAIPRQDTQTAVYWVSPEGTDLTEAEAVFDLVTMTPHTLGARSQITRQMLLQSTPDIEMLVRADLTQVMALAIDLASIAGTGTGGQPTGIINKAGIASVALGTNGAASSIDTAIAMETLLMNANTPEDTVAYMTNSTVIGGWKTLKDTTGRYLWTQYPGIFGQRTPAPGEINGYPVFRSNQVPKNLTKGTGTNLNAIIMACWSELIIGEWGVLEVLPNPYGAGFNSGSVDIRALQSIDICMRHATSFCAVTDATQ